MTQQQIFEWLEHPERLNRETLCELRTLLARYPYFQTARLLYLKNLFLLHDPSFNEELRKAALYISDRKVLFYLIEGERFSPASLEVKEVPKEEGADRTLSLIDSFLATLPDEPAVPLGIPLDVTADYTSLLLREGLGSDESAPQLKGQNLIDEFIGKQAEIEKGLELLADRKKEEAGADSELTAGVELELTTGADSELATDSEPELTAGVEPETETELEGMVGVGSAVGAEPELAVVAEADVVTDVVSDRTEVENVVDPLMTAQVTMVAEPTEAAEPEAEIPETEVSETEEPTDEEMEEESYFTETLAKIYVKQQRYSKALEIIKKLNLKYPKKNAYFADQIRFLEKLIINTKSK